MLPNRQISHNYLVVTEFEKWGCTFVFKSILYEFL